MKHLFICLVLVIAVHGCTPEVIITDCQYDETAGTATIVSIEAAPDGELNCPNNAVKILFDFTPANEADADKAATGRQLTIADGYNPPRDWAQNEGLDVGSEIACVRNDITNGTCTPIIYSFPTLDVEGATEICHEEPESDFSLTVYPESFNNTIVGQRCVLLVTVNESPEISAIGDDVTITATAEDAEVIIEPQQLTPRDVGEITIIPSDVGEITTTTDMMDMAEDYPYGKGHIIDVTVTAERNGYTESQTIELNVMPGEDSVEEAAREILDRFVPWLEENHPEFNITSETQWTPTIVNPSILIVTHYLFFSEEWELGMTWHVMIPPDDWGRIYLRHRFDSSVPQYAYEISSLAAEPEEEPQETDVPEQVDR